MVMKKIILAIALITGLVSVASAENDSVHAHINNTLHLLFKMTDTTYLVNAGNYRQTNIVYRGMPVTVFKNKTSGWCGCFKHLSPENLPEKAVSMIKSKYKNCEIKNVVLYFNDESTLTYFAEITVNNRFMVLKIPPAGRVKVFS